jgi:alpha-L-arabinofuranosidase
MTNMSPLVNARGPIYAYPGGVVLRPTYHVAELYASRLAREVLDAHLRVRSFEAGPPEGPGPAVAVPHGDAVVTVDRDRGGLAVSLSNLHPDEPLDCEIWVPGRELTGGGELVTLTGASADSYNDVSHPGDVSPVTAALPASGEPAGGDRFRVRLSPHSLTILRLDTTPAATRS